MGTLAAVPPLKPYRKVLGMLRWLLPHVVTLLPAVGLPLMYEVIM